MQLRLTWTKLVAVGIVVTACVGRAGALETTFTYQGQLLQDGVPTTGTCDLQVSLFDAASGGTQIGSLQPASPVSVTGGLFTVQLNDGNEFGANAFNGSDRWLQIAVRCPVGTGSYTTLSPRQQLTATPYALYAPAAGSANNLACSGCVGPTALAPNAVTDQSVASGISYSKLFGAPTALPPSGAAGGSLTGTYPNPSIASGAVGPAQLQSNAVSSATIADGTVASVDVGFNYAGSSSKGGAASDLACAACVSPTEISAGSVGQVLTTTAGGVGWQTPAGGGSGVLSVGASAPLASSGGQNPTVALTGNVPVANGGTGASTAAAARNSLGAASSGANADITSLLGITGNISLQESTSSTTGNILKGGVPFIHNFGDRNTFVGENAGNFSMTGSVNTAFGDSALQSNTTGTENTAVGQAALSFDTSGAYNTAVGQGALESTIFGLGNTAVGDGALQASDADGNTAVGLAALFDNIDGGMNIAVGGGALQHNTSGSSNVAVGTYAALNTTGSANIALGYRAGALLTTGDKNIDIGNAGVAGDANTIRIGNTQTSTFVAGIFGATSSSGVAVFVNSSGQLGTTTSSARFKDDIQDMGDSTSALLKLRPVRFRYKQNIDPSGLEQYGLVAEEVAQIYPDLVVYDDEGQPQTVRYHFVNAMLLNEVQKQARQIAEQAQQVADLRERLATLEAAIAPGR